jgi:hypothetical protein
MLDLQGLRAMTSTHLRCVGIAALLVGTVAPSAAAQDASKGAALMAAARQAIGGENRLAAVKTLQVTGTFRRVIGNNDSDGDFEVFLELPDKYLRNEKTGTPGQPSTETIEALVGTTMRDVVRGGGGRGGGDRNAAGNPDGRAGAGGGDSAEPADGGVDRGVDPGDADGRGRGQGAGENVGTGPGRGRGGSGVDLDTQRSARRAEVGRLLLMWLARSDGPVTWIGIAEAPDGKADVLEARFAGDSTRLFLDAASHMPLMMTWQGVPGPGGGPGGRRGGDGRRGRGQGQPAAGVPDTGAAPGGPPQPMTFEMTFADHRVVNGLKLPHVITRGINGMTIERWTIRSYRVNPSFNADTFTR